MKTSKARTGWVILLLALFLGSSSADMSSFSSSISPNLPDTIKTTFGMQAKAGIKTTLEKTALNIKDKAKEFADQGCEGCHELVSQESSSFFIIFLTRLKSSASRD